mmetsp:Transcript_22340/g.27434  ORF Transcript_22340/g.27434 Transcript_22340/m.27434 type:complete len:314 (-) Transcript_22340:1230-2171(-)
MSSPATSLPRSASTILSTFELAKLSRLLLDHLQLLHHLAHVAGTATDLVFHLGELLLQHFELHFLALEGVICGVAQRSHLRIQTILFYQIHAVIVGVLRVLFFRIVIIIIRVLVGFAAALLGTSCALLTLLIRDPTSAIFRDTSLLLVRFGGHFLVLVEACADETYHENDLHHVSQEERRPRVVIAKRGLQSRLNCQNLPRASFNSHELAISCHKHAEEGLVFSLGGSSALRQAIDRRLWYSLSHHGSQVILSTQVEVQRCGLYVPCDDQRAEHFNRVENAAVFDSIGQRDPTKCLAVSLSSDELEKNELVRL